MRYTGRSVFVLGCSLSICPVAESFELPNSFLSKGPIESDLQTNCFISNVGEIFFQTPIYFQKATSPRQLFRQEWLRTRTVPNLNPPENIGSTLWFIHR
jgi:hypothetical protein